MSAAVRARREHVQARLLWVCAAGLLSLGITVLPFAETGSWASLALGRVITAHGMPTTEPFSYLAAIQPWVAAGWLRAVLIAALVGTGGATLASIVLGLATSGGLVLAALSVRPSARVPAAWQAAGVLAGALVVRSFLAGGVPIMVLGAGAVLYVLARAREGNSRLAWLLPPIFLVWANLDGSFITGLVIVLVVWAAEGRRDAEFRRALLWATAASAVAAVINPAGIGLYQWVLATAGGPATAQLSTTFSSPDFHGGWLRLFEAVAALLVISWVAGGGATRLDAILGIAAIGLALWSQQFVPLFAVIATPQLSTYGSRASARAVPHLPQMRAPAAVRDLGAAVGRLGRPVLTGAALAATAVAAVAAMTVEAGAHAAATAESSRFPQAAATRVAASFPGQRLYAPSTWGDYLTERFPTGRVVFIYGPSGGFTTSSVTAYATIHFLDPGWEAVVRTEGIRIAIVEDRSQEAGALHELGWAADCFDASSGALVMTAPGSGAPSTPSSPLTVPPSGVLAC
ncbi:MAG: hypothetical protein JOZ75_05315 [Candidatus Dormibacteraeota bacterium]|nr:hypothetical protein [Candidatus Dormibacteraeota bacterium]